MTQTPDYLPRIREALAEGHLLWKKHALERMMEREITRKAVKQVVLEGYVLEVYPDDYPVPSLLIGALTPEPLHVVLAWDDEHRQCHIITAYRPDREYFEEDLITRRKP